jgi:hypothetical protein
MPARRTIERSARSKEGLMAESTARTMRDVLTALCERYGSERVPSYQAFWRHCQGGRIRTRRQGPLLLVLSTDQEVAEAIGLSEPPKPRTAPKWRKPKAAQPTSAA